MGGKPDKLKKVQYSNMYRTDDVSIVPFVYPRETVSVSSLGYFSSVGSSYKPSRPSLPLSLLAP